MKFYRYLYFRLYSWNLKTWGEKDVPQWNAMLGVSFMMFVNFCTIALILQMVGFVNFFTDDIPKAAIFAIMLLLFVTNYFQLVHKCKFKLILDEFKGESTKRRIVNAVYLWLYAVCSFAIILVLAITYGNMKNY